MSIFTGLFGSLSGWLMALIALVSLFGTGCVADDVARGGMFSRGDTKADLEWNDAGDVRRANLSAGGGSGSDFMASRDTWYENGTPKSKTLITDNQSVMQMQYFAGVRGQSQQDASNVGTVLTSVTMAIQQVATTAIGFQTQMAELKRESAEDRAERNRRDDKRDAQFAELVAILKPKVAP